MTKHNDIELWDLLDENGNKIGKTHIRGEKYPTGLYHKGVDIWIKNSQGQLLVQKRSKNKDSYPGIWAMTGGSVLSGEESVHAIHRETLEELGIDIDTSKLKFLFTAKTSKAFIDTYLYKSDISLNKLVLQKEEVEKAAWCTPDEIEELAEKGEFIKSRWDDAKKYLI